MKTLRLNDDYMRVKECIEEDGWLKIQPLMGQPLSYKLKKNDDWEVIEHEEIKE